MVLDFLLKNIDSICPPKTPLFLHYHSPFELLIMVILSAQTTDRQVNEVAPSLFKAYPTPSAMAEAPLVALESLIYTTGFYHAKAGYIKETATELVSRFGGQVPTTMKDLLTLKGVGRKTANVVLGTLFNEPAIIVDTHFKRVTNRLGLTASQNPVLIEKELKAQIPEVYQYRVSMWLNKLGRDVCLARKPLCPRCVFAHVCPSSLV
jgi:endonuclease-3